MSEAFSHNEPYRCVVCMKLKKVGPASTCLSSYVVKLTTTKCESRWMISFNWETTFLEIMRCKPSRTPSCLIPSPKPSQRH